MDQNFRYAVAFIGYGEAAYNISLGMSKEHPTKMIAFDMMHNDPERGPLIRKRMAEVGVDEAESAEQAIRDAKFIISLTSAAVAVKVAEGIMGKLVSGQVYVDMNSASPMSMEEIDRLKRCEGVLFCDVGVLGSVPEKKHQTKMVLSGDGSDEFYAFMKDYSPNLTVLGKPAGSASAIKMFKSVFNKGFPQLLLECLVPAARYGVYDMVLDGIKNTFAKRNLEQYGDSAMFRTLIHAKRRAAEMSEVADTVEALGYGAEMSRAACTRLERLAGYDYARRIGLEQPKLKEVIDMVCADDLTEAQK